MRRGVPFIPVPTEADPMPHVRLVHGHRVRYDTRCPCAEARGMLRWAYIAVGPPWFWLPEDEKEAVLLHEVGHLEHHHLAKRFAILPFFWTEFAKRMARSQEMQADAYANKYAAGEAMQRFLSRSNEGNDLYPAPADRIARLRGMA